MWSMDPEVMERGLAFADGSVDRVVDVGGGPGRAVEVVDAAQRIVVDAAPGMLRRARTRGLGTVQGDARSLPFVNASVDAVLVVDALHHIDDHERVCREAARVLRPGGVLLVREFDPTTLRGRGLVLAERLVGFHSTFRAPADLLDIIGDAGLVPHLPEEGFGYTAVGVKPTSA